MSDRPANGAALGGRRAFVVTGVLVGVAFLVIGLATGKPAFGIAGLVIMLAYAAGTILLSRRSESAALLSGGGSDERQQQLMLKAGATAGYIVTVVLVGGFLVALATKSDSEGLWSALCAVAGVSFIASTIFYSRRG